MSEGVLEVTANGRIVYANKAAISLFRKAEEKLLASIFLDLFRGEDREKLKELLKGIRDASETNAMIALLAEEHDIKSFSTQDPLREPARTLDLNYIYKDGAIIPIEITGNVLFSEGEEKIIILVRDITSRKRMEEEILKVHKLESVGILAGGIAHDFNNYLAAILGNVSLAKTILGSGDEDVLGILEDAEKASFKARNLTQQLLTFSRGGAPVKETASISELIKESCRFTLSGSNVRPELSLPEELWPVDIDVGQVSQVINNLLINADQAMPKGGIINVEAENVLIRDEHSLPVKSGRYVKISVIDRGTGIPEDHLPLIFDPFFTTKQKGSGLGLATAYSIVRNHDGYTTVDSEVEAGTTFRIYLPASDKEILPEAEVEKTPLPGDGRILIMDDEDMVRRLSGKMLGRIGYDVEYARDGAEAIEIYKMAVTSGQPFDAVILDLTVPGGMGGKDALGKLIEIDPHVKAIVSSGYSTDQVMADFRSYGFKGVVAKPYEFVELARVVREVVLAS